MVSEKITVVVPIYNVEAYLRRCLDSILGQTYSDIEIMLVDDGSPDNSGAICDEYAATDDRIRVFHIPNGGVAKARQLGVERSTGAYIVFVDPDDWLPLDALSILYSQMDTDIGICIGGYNRVCHKIISRSLKDERLSPDQYRRYFLDKKIPPSPWGKLYRRLLFNADSFPEFKRGQDMLMNIKISTLNNMDVVLCSGIVCNYNEQRLNNTTNTFKNTFEYEKKFTHQIYDYFKSAGLYGYYYDEIMRFSLLRLYDVIVSGNKCFRKDLWVNEVFRNTNFFDVSFRGKLTKIAVVFPILQMLLWKMKKYSRHIHL